MTDQQVLLSGLALFAVMLLVVLLRKPLAWLLSVALRSAFGGGLLACLAPVGQHFGFHLGVNLCNALTIGVLGAPEGLGLLLLLDWLVSH